MLDVRGFRGLRFNPGRIEAFDDVITPPFDVISPGQRTALASKSPHNIVHIILPHDEDDKNKYAVAQEKLEAWIADGVLAQDESDAFYLVRQTFRGLDGKEHVRRGFFGVVKVPEKDERTILGHERTFAYKIADRLALTVATRTNLGAVFSLYRDPEQQLTPFLDQMNQREPDATATTIDGVRQEFWRTPHDEQVSAFFRDKTLYIADGHHRFATAEAYRDQRREELGHSAGGPLQRYDYVLMGFVDYHDPGFMIYPTHRLLDLPEGCTAESLLKKLQPWFTTARVGGDLAPLVEKARGTVFGLALNSGERYLLTLRDIPREQVMGTDRTAAWRDLDVALLHKAILEKTLGLEEGAEFVNEHSAQIALERVANGEKQAAFLLKGVTPEQLLAVADAADPMPQKSTYIFPKLPTGGAMHRLV